MDEQENDGRAGFNAYMDALIGGIGHADRAEPLRDYCLGLMMPVARKSVEPLAAVIETSSAEYARARTADRVSFTLSAREQEEIAVRTGAIAALDTIRTGF
jgi:SRSO17 transposase